MSFALTVLGHKLSLTKVEYQEWNGRILIVRHERIMLFMRFFVVVDFIDSNYL